MEITRKKLIEAVTAGMPVKTDSRKIIPGDVFIAVHGASANGGDYIESAVRNGAVHIAVEESCVQNCGECEHSVWQDTREAAWRLASAFYHTEDIATRVFGITGTNGKTTSAALLEYFLTASGHKTANLGTISYHWPGFRQKAPLTTPDALYLHSMLAGMDRDGVEYAVMEVSSHALDQQRIGGINFAGALFTNLTQDHLDYHGNMEEYFQAKARLFTEYPGAGKICAINTDDAYGKRLSVMAKNVITFGLVENAESANHLLGKIISSGPEGQRLKMFWQGKEWEIFSHLPGKFNAMNLLGVQALLVGYGFSWREMGKLEDFQGVSGRLERIANTRGLNIFVDYAHTPDALVNAQQALKEAGFKRLVVVFGCGGNRDRTKRPLMGEAVAKYADIAVLTSDNPRLEDPLAIIRDVKPGLQAAKEVIIEPDRKKATHAALELLQPEDALLIAGKGHEDYQILGDRKIHYSDQEIVKEFLR